MTTNLRERIVAALLSKFTVLPASDIEAAANRRCMQNQLRGLDEHGLLKGVECWLKRRSDKALTYNQKAALDPYAPNTVADDSDFASIGSRSASLAATTTTTTTTTTTWVSMPMPQISHRLTQGTTFDFAKDDSDSECLRITKSTVTKTSKKTKRSGVDRVLVAGSGGRAYRSTSTTSRDLTSFASRTGLSRCRHACAGRRSKCRGFCCRRRAKSARLSSSRPIGATQPSTGVANDSRASPPEGWLHVPPARLSVAPRSRPPARTRGGRAPRRRRHDARRRTAQRDHWRSGRHGAESGCGCCLRRRSDSELLLYSYVATRTRSGSTNGGPPAAPGQRRGGRARAAASSPHAPPVPAPPAGPFQQHGRPRIVDHQRMIHQHHQPTLLTLSSAAFLEEAAAFGNENRQNKRRGCGAFFHLMIRRTTRM